MRQGERSSQWSAYGNGGHLGITSKHRGNTRFRVGTTGIHWGITRAHRIITRLNRGSTSFHRGITKVHSSAARWRWCRIGNPVHAAFIKGVGDKSNSSNSTSLLSSV